MIKVREEAYPSFLKHVFRGRMGAWLETAVLSVAGLIVLWMILGFELPEGL